MYYEKDKTVAIMGRFFPLREEPISSEIPYGSGLSAYLLTQD
jgi:hypothetical protein